MALEHPSTLVKTVLASCLILPGIVFSTVSARAIQSQVGFAGDFAPSEWTLEQWGGDGAIDDSAAPSQLVLSGSNINGSSLAPSSSNYTVYTASAPYDGVVSFDWFFSNSDKRLETSGSYTYFDHLGFILGQKAHPLASADGSSGSSSFGILTGQVFGWYILSDDQSSFALNPQAASVSVSNFEFRADSTIRRGLPPSSVPAPFPVLGGLAAFGWSRKIRSRIRVASHLT